ncbi:inactive serine protease 54 [Eublepharis macularius]|uniref:Inactive serine protease 54 n=1 Tax=Eublepharis macularius TaxID=481883 RepID=A0AA97KIX4_EUBMA|nr:inactive serine protease 54 [Eublepharis macularius]
MRRENEVRRGERLDARGRTEEVASVSPRSAARGRAAPLGCHVGGLFLLCLSILHYAQADADCGPRVAALLGSKQDVTSAGEFPWVVSLRDFYNNHIAMGCILSQYWIISVAASFQNRSQIFAVPEVTGQKSSRSTPFPISAIFLPEDFDELTLAHNIGLLKVADPLEFSETVQPICFPHEDFPTNALKSCVVAGWRNPRAGRGSLMKLPVEDIDPCPLKRTMTTECSSHREGDDAVGCLGDPGNPLMCQATETGHWLLKGVLTEGGTRCYGPFLYTRLSHYSDWIVTTTAKGGAPIYPTLGRRDFAVRTPAEEPRGVLEPFLDSRVLNFSKASEDHPLSSDAEPQEGSAEEFLDGPARPQGKSLPVYYDYYSGEQLPISTANRGQPHGLLTVSFLLHLLTCSMTA